MSEHSESSVQQSGTPNNSAESVHRDNLEPAPVNNALSRFMNIVPTTAESFHGTVGGMTSDEWLNHTKLWMHYIRVPEEFKVAVASTLLRREALDLWSTHVENSPEDAWTWEIFGQTLNNHFEQNNQVTIWKRRVLGFRQNYGESVARYVERFDNEIVAESPWHLGQTEMRTIFLGGLHPNNRPPQGWLRVGSFMDLVRSIINYEREFNHLFIPQAPRAGPAGVVPPGQGAREAPEAAPVPEQNQGAEPLQQPQAPNGQAIGEEDAEDSEEEDPEEDIVPDSPEHDDSDDPDYDPGAL